MSERSAIFTLGTGLQIFNLTDYLGGTLILSGAGVWKLTLRRGGGLQRPPYLFAVFFSTPGPIFTTFQCVTVPKILNDTIPIPFFRYYIFPILKKWTIPGTGTPHSIFALSRPDKKLATCLNMHFLLFLGTTFVWWGGGVSSSPPSPSFNRVNLDPFPRPYFGNGTRWCLRVVQLLWLLLRCDWPLYDHRFASREHFKLKILPSRKW